MDPGLQALQERVRTAAASKTPLAVAGGGTKAFYGNESRGQAFDVRAVSGIVDYEPTELVVTDITEGEGAAAEEGDTVVVHYVGVRSEDGTEFDNSFDRGEPFTVTLGAGGVIAGWDEGLVG
ncbi:MAG: FKBP-type peptidyl-prolyl cis-trans isomerase, partial [Burkholderiaceae bacterium]